MTNRSHSESASAPLLQYLLVLLHLEKPLTPSTMASFGYLSRFLKVATPEDLKSTNIDDCCICLGGFSKPERKDSANTRGNVCDHPIKLSCGHIFGRKCIVRTMQMDRSCWKCPVCRRRPNAHGEAVTTYNSFHCLLSISPKRFAAESKPFWKDLDQSWSNCHQKYREEVLHFLLCIPITYFQWIALLDSDGNMFLRASKIRQAFYAVFEQMVPSTDEDLWADFEEMVAALMESLAAKFCRTFPAGRVLLSRGTLKVEIHGRRLRILMPSKCGGKQILTPPLFRLATDTFPAQNPRINLAPVIGEDAPVHLGPFRGVFPQSKFLHY